MDEQFYSNPLVSRYASSEVAQLFGAQKKFGIWRRLWLALAEAQQELGLADPQQPDAPRITDEQLAEMRNHLDDIDFQRAAEYERRLRHDVMAHVHTFGDACPGARDIIHLGATSCFVTDNADLILLAESTQLILHKLAVVIHQLASFAEAHRALPTLGLTHLQPAQPTTVGKRATLWAYDLILDLRELEHRVENLQFRGAVGTTGSQASFLQLFDGDQEKVVQLNRRVAEKMGFAETIPVTGQTYSRKIDAQFVDALSGIGQSSHKIATDLRILASRKEIEEPFEEHQIGSSAMAYKRNPMRCERICSLARFLISLQNAAAYTPATQWMERTLDDSANRRLVLPQAFLAADAILILLQNVTRGLVVYDKVIERHLNEELPFLATENILMAATRSGGDRQLLHERVRQHSLAAADVVKREGRPNDLLERLKADPNFSHLNLDDLLDPSAFIGRAPAQVDEFICNEVDPIRARFRGALDQTPVDELRV